MTRALCETRSCGAKSLTRSQAYRLHQKLGDNNRLTGKSIPINTQKKIHKKKYTKPSLASYLRGEEVKLSMAPHTKLPQLDVNFHVDCVTPEDSIEDATHSSQGPELTFQDLLTIFALEANRRLRSSGSDRYVFLEHVLNGRQWAVPAAPCLPALSATSSRLAIANQARSGDGGIKFRCGESWCRLSLDSLIQQARRGVQVRILLPRS